MSYRHVEIATCVGVFCVELLANIDVHGSNLLDSQGKKAPRTDPKLSRINLLEKVSRLIFQDSEKFWADSLLN